MANINDPYVINPRGTKVKVPLGMVNELLKKGYVLADEQWRKEEEDRVFEKSVNIDPKKIKTEDV